MRRTRRVQAHCCTEPHATGLARVQLPSFRTLPPANRLVLYGGLGLIGIAITGAVLGLSGAVGYYQGRPRLLILKRIALPNRVLVPAAARAFSAMSEQAARDGVTLRVNSAYRSYGEQAALYAAHCAKGLARGKWAPPGACVPDPPTAKPGRSTHQIGLSVDIQTDDGTNAASHWLDSNAGRYGFVRDVAGEPWHHTFRGQGSMLAGLSLGDGCYGCGGC